MGPTASPDPLIGAPSWAPQRIAQGGAGQELDHSAQRPGQAVGGQHGASGEQQEQEDPVGHRERGLGAQQPGQGEAPGTQGDGAEDHGCDHQQRLVHLRRPAQSEGHGADQHELHDDHGERGRRLADQQPGAGQGSGPQELQDPGAPLEAGGDRRGREGRRQDRQGHHPGGRLIDLGQPEPGDADQDGDRDDEGEQELLPVGHQLPPLETRLRPPPGHPGGSARGRRQVEGHLWVRCTHACACPSAVAVVPAVVAPPEPAREVISK